MGFPLPHHLCLIYFFFPRPEIPLKKLKWPPLLKFKLDAHLKTWPKGKPFLNAMIYYHCDYLRACGDDLARSVPPRRSRSLQNLQFSFRNSTNSCCKWMEVDARQADDSGRIYFAALWESGLLTIKHKSMHPVAPGNNIYQKWRLWNFAPSMNIMGKPAAATSKI